MKTRNSEYQRSYCDHDVEYRKDVYTELTAYRHLRRDEESRHQQIKWDSDSGSSSNASSIDEIPQEDPTDEMENQEDEEMKQNDDQKENKVTDDKTGPEAQIENEEEECTGRSSKAKIPKLIAVDKPPFLSYGWADKELETARKLTHNVLADNKYVHPGALKKLKNLKEDRKRQQNRAESRASVAAALMFKQKKEVHDVWMTEYQRCYSRASVTPPQSADSITSKARPSKRSRPSTGRKKQTRSSLRR